MISTTTIEGFPFVVTEFLRMGTPVIITDVGGNKDCIIPEYNGDILNFKGLYVDEIYEKNIYRKLINQLYENEEYNIKEFVNVISKYLNNPNKILEMSLNALETIKYKYSQSIRYIVHILLLKFYHINLLKGLQGAILQFCSSIESLAALKLSAV